VLLQKQLFCEFVSEVLGEKMNWKHATVKTLLNRLLEKEVLKKKEKGNKYIYYTEYNEQEIAKQYVMETFFPEQGYCHAGTPDFEAYSEGDMCSPDYRMELWVPIVKVD